MSDEPWFHVTWGVPDPAVVDDPLLDDAERARCARLRRADDRARHASARLLVKRAAAEFYGVPAQAVRVVPDVGEHAGRPLLVVAGVAQPFHVSIAHAGGVVVVAFADVPVGVDVEQVAPMAGVVDSEIVWSATELSALASEPEACRLELACDWWTAKEAALKAVGRGIVEDLTAVDAADSETSLVSLGVRHHVRLRRLRAPEGYRATLALVTGMG